VADPTLDADEALADSDAVPPVVWRAQLTGHEQRWLTICRATIPRGAEQLDQLLHAGSPHFRALTRSTRRWPKHAESADPGSDPAFRITRDQKRPDLSAAGAILAVARQLAAPSDEPPAVRAAVEHWQRAELPSTDGEQGFPESLFEVGNSSTRQLLLDIERGRLPLRGFLALLALHLAGAEFPRGPHVEQPVLFDEGTDGSSGKLRLQVVVGGPPGLHPDPARMAFLVTDADFADATRLAWRTSPLNGSDTCVTWSLRDRNGPVNDVKHGSLGASFAVGLDEIHQLRNWHGRHLRLRQLDTRRVAVTGGLSPGSDRLEPVTGYPNKLAAARQAELRRVVVPEASLKKDDSRKELDQAGREAGIRVVGAATVEEAIRRTRTGLTLTSALAAVIAVLILAAGTTYGTTLWAFNKRIDEARAVALALSLVDQAEQLRSTNPGRALQLNLAAVKLVSNDETRNGLATTLGATPLTGSSDDDQNVTTVAFRPDGHTLATGGGRLRLWDVTNPRAPARTASIDDDQNVTAVAFSPDGHTLATATATGTGIDSSAGGRLRLWDVTNPRAPARTASIDDDQNVTAVAFSPDGHALATASSSLAGGRLRLWDVTNPRAPVRTASVDDAGFGVTAVAFSPDGHTLATGSTLIAATIMGGGVGLWDITEPHNPVRRGDIGDDQPVEAVAFGPDGHTLATASSGLAGGRLRLWDVTNPRNAGRIASFDDDESVEGVAFSPNGRTLATASSGFAGGRLRLWDPVNAHGPVRTASVDDDQNLTAVAFSPDGHTLATASTSLAGGRLRLWDVSNPRAPARTASIDDDQNVRAVAFSPDGHTLAVATAINTDGGAGGRLRLWDVTNPRAPVRIASIDDDENATAVAFSPDGHTLANTIGGLLQLWDVSNPRSPVRSASIDDGQYIDSVVFSPDGRTLATAGGSTAGRLFLWDVSNPRAPVRTASIDDEWSVDALAFSPDSRMLVTVRNPSAMPFGGILGLWDVSSPRAPVRTASIDDGQYIDSVAFSPDGRTLATATHTGVGISAQGRLRLWDVTSPRAPVRTASVDDAGFGVTAVAFSPDGRTLATASATDAASGGGKVWLWYIGWSAALSGRLEALACSAAGGGLSAEEWHDAVPGISYRRTCETLK
jgi:WD40 repeat protein